MHITNKNEIQAHLKTLFLKGVSLALSNKNFHSDIKAFFTKSSYGAGFVHLELLSVMPDEIIKGMPLAASYSMNGFIYAFKAIMVEVPSQWDIIISIPTSIEETPRRKYPRVDCPKGLPNEVYVCHSTKCFMANFLEISMGGFSFVSGETMDAGTELRTIRIILPKGKNIQMGGVIRRATPVGSCGHSKGFRYGVEFTNIPASEKEKLKDYIANISKGKPIRAT